MLSKLDVDSKIWLHVLLRTYDPQEMKLTQWLKRKRIWFSHLTKVPIPSENESKETTQRRHNNFYTMIADRLWTVRLSNYL